MDTPSAAGNNNGIKVFIARHEQIFTLFGSMLVLVSFFLKEDYRDHSKDMSASLESANTNRLNVTRLQRIESTINAASLRISSPENSEEGLTEVELAYRKAAKANTQMGNVINSFKDELSSDDSLYAQLPSHPEELMKSRKVATDTVERLLKRNNDLYVEYLRLSEKPAQNEIDAGAADVGTVPATAREWNAIAENIDNFCNSTDLTPSDNLYFYSTKVSEEAERQVREQKQRTTLLSRVLNLTFLVGWFMGLASKVMKAPSLAVGGAD